jgi:2-polyprenyl-3-methyl-5-hydroxy-6-metoxy-1,4-benzoquinol methylase
MPIQGTRVGRPWRQRLDDLLACEVDYANKTVLDAGCNVGILAYEIAKRGPSFIHAIDGSRPVLDAARLIFRSVETPHRLDLVDLTDNRRLRAVLADDYDVVQLLAVYMHVASARGDRMAKRMLATLAERCKGTFIVASNVVYLPAIIETLLSAGLAVHRETVSPSQRVKHLVFCREEAAATQREPGATG